MIDHSEPQDLLVFKSELIIPVGAIERFNIYIPTFIAGEYSEGTGWVRPREKYFLYSRDSFDLLMKTFFTEYNIRRTITIILTQDEEIHQYSLAGGRVMRSNLNFIKFESLCFTYHSIYSASDKELNDKDIENSELSIT